jgi:transcriptional regulator with XRE-family HTH domain
MWALGQWTGHEALLLRRALRMSVRDFADYLGVSARTVSKWAALSDATSPLPRTQAILDTALTRAEPDARQRFQRLVDEHSLSTGIAIHDPTDEWDRDTWADDLTRAATCVAQQKFAFAARLTQRWLLRYSPSDLDRHGLQLYARTLVVLGDIHRDQGRLRGPHSADSSYREAHRLFRTLGSPRRMAQIELGQVVIEEMSGHLEPAARHYDILASDHRLSARDRTRARLWVGTSLSKKNDGDTHAITAMTAASRAFDDLDEPEDWAVAQQKLALAHRGAGDLGAALRHIDTARNATIVDTPMQLVRLDTAHAHILLSDRHTADLGLVMLSEAAHRAGRYGLSHQLASITTIQGAFQRQSR